MSATISAQAILDGHDAVALAGGAESSRDLPVPGRDLAGVHFAMDFLPQQNRRVSGEPVGTNEPILAGGKHVVVIGGGGRPGSPPFDKPAANGFGRESSRGSGRDAFKPPREAADSSGKLIGMSAAANALSSEPLLIVQLLLQIIEMQF